MNSAVAQVLRRFSSQPPPPERAGPGPAASRRGQLWHPLPADGLAWVQQQFPAYFQDAQGHPVPLAPRHVEFWQWVWALRPGTPVPALFAVWPRGGGKSTAAELACAAIGYHGLRRYGLYISSVQQQADDHVQNVATMLERLGVDRSLNKYGYSRGWRVNRLRTAAGFVLDAIGLEVAARGVKLDEGRPDLLICDDLDEENDSDQTLLHKEKALTRKLLPAGTPDVAVLGVQNLPHPEGLFTKIVQGRAEYLRQRQICGPYPALAGCTDPWYTLVEAGHGPPHYRITSGTPTWAGQDLAACEALLNRIGPTAFEVECQHKVDLLNMSLFPREKWKSFDVWPSPDWFEVLVQSWDATFGNEKAHGSYVAGHLWGRKGPNVFLLARTFARLSFLDTCDAVETMAQQWPGAYVKLIEDKGNGVAIYETLRSRVFGLSPQPVTSASGSKYARANSVAHLQRDGRAWLPSPRLATWVTDYIDYMYHFPKAPNDDGDATSQAWRYLFRPPPLPDRAREQAEKQRRLLRTQLLALDRRGGAAGASRTRV